MPPVSGAAAASVGPAVAVTPVTGGIPAYVALTDPEWPAMVSILTGTVSGPSVGLSISGATIWISVPVTVTRSGTCEAARVGSPKSTHLRPARLRPVPLIVTIVSPFSLASENGPPSVEMEVIVGGGK